jgi:cytochrome bd-type quinol oxidase subunit 1
MDAVRVIFAAVVAVLFVVFAIFLVTNADTSDQREWERWVYVFGAAEAIAFAALGWVFGKEVNRQRAEAAEDTAKKAKKGEADERAKGASLAGMVTAGMSAAGGRERLESQGAAPAGGIDQAVEYARREYGL